MNYVCLCTVCVVCDILHDILTMTQWQTNNTPKQTNNNNNNPQRLLTKNTSEPIMVILEP